VYLIAILLALVSFVAPAQSRPLDFPAGSVHGTVLVISPDGRSHVASGAQVRLIGATKDASQSAVADYSGQYKFDGVPPGGYQLEVALDIFKKVAKPITIRAGETTVEDVKLELKGRSRGSGPSRCFGNRAQRAAFATCSDREPKFPWHTDSKREGFARQEQERPYRRQRRGTLQYVQPKRWSTLRERAKPNGTLPRILFARDVGLEKLSPQSQPQG
jgi:hypothetical protein